jgi:hypothetical protein
MTHGTPAGATPLAGYGDIRFDVQVDILRRPQYWDLGMA